MLHHWDIKKHPIYSYCTQSLIHLRRYPASTERCQGHIGWLEPPHEQDSTKVQYLSPFSTALHLIPTIEAMVEYNVAQLGQPIATIKAVHTGPNAAKAPADDAGGLEAVIYISPCDAYKQPLCWCWPGKWSNGYYTSHLVQNWRTTWLAHCCHGSLWQLLWSNLPWWHCAHLTSSAATQAGVSTGGH